LIVIVCIFLLCRLTILLTEIMSLMFRESEIIPARIQTLKAER
jgi:hypothetical protein